MFALWRKKTSDLATGEFVILAAFVVAVTVGLLYGAVIVAVSGNRPAAVAPPAAPTVDAYRAEAQGVLAPFFEQAQRMTSADLAAPSSELVDLVAKTQERLLRLVVPKEEKDVHLALVLLLEQWKRALAGSAADREAVIDKTRQMIAKNRWLIAK